MMDNTIQTTVDEASHRCLLCEKTFAFKNSLTKHIEKRRCSILKEAKVKKGGTYCSAINCSNSYGSDCHRGIKFYRFPKDITRRERWIRLVRQRGPNGALWNPGPASRLCSEHFVLGLKSNDPHDQNYEPSIFVAQHVKEEHVAEPKFKPR